MAYDSDAHDSDTHAIDLELETILRDRENDLVEFCLDVAPGFALALACAGLCAKFPGGRMAIGNLFLWIQPFLLGLFLRQRLLYRARPLFEHGFFQRTLARSSIAAAGVPGRILRWPLLYLVIGQAVATVVPSYYWLEIVSEWIEEAKRITEEVKRITEEFPEEHGGEWIFEFSAEDYRLMFLSLVAFQFAGIAFALSTVPEIVGKRLRDPHREPVFAEAFHSFVFVLAPITFLAMALLVWVDTIPYAVQIQTWTGMGFVFLVATIIRWVLMREACRNRIEEVRGRIAREALEARDRTRAASR